MRTYCKFDGVLMSSMKSGSTWLAALLQDHSKIKIHQGQKFIINESGIFSHTNQIDSCKVNLLRSNLKTDIAYLKSFQNSNANMKFVTLLRNPIDRAYSHYKHKIRKYQVINRNDLLEADFIKPTRSGLFHKTYDFNKDIQTLKQRGTPFPEYIQKSLFYECLFPYFEVFGIEAFFINCIEEVSRNPSKLITEISKHFGVTEKASDAGMSGTVINKESFKADSDGLLKRKVTIVPPTPETIGTLTEIMQSDIVRLDSALGTNYASLWFANGGMSK